MDPVIPPKINHRIPQIPIVLLIIFLIIAIPAAGYYLSKVQSDNKQAATTYSPSPKPTQNIILLNDLEKSQIDNWIQTNKLNRYGDPADTAYTGGTPLFNEATGETTDRYVYIAEKHADRPWCTPRPACLDATPRCLIAESTDMCPSRETTDPTANWKTYQGNGYSFKYPQNWDVNDKESSRSAIFDIHQAQPGAPGFPVFYVSVIPNNFINRDTSVYNFWNQNTLDNLFSLKIGDSYTTQQEIYPKRYWTYKRLSDTTVNGYTGIVVENSSVWEYLGSDRRILLKKDKSTFEMGMYYKNNSDLVTFNQIISTFKFTK